MSSCPRWALALALLLGCSGGAERPPADEKRAAPLASMLGDGSDAADYAQVERPRELVFPDDHGPHPDHRVEWWYLTGNLSTAGGERYGYQFTLFRIALAPSPADGPDSERGDGLSAWATRQLYMAHLGLSDVEGRRFHSAERYSRGAVGLAGVEARPFAAWLNDWSLRSSSDGELFPARLRAADGEIEIDLTIEAGKPMILHGDRGLSRKSGDAASASYYYSFTRLPSRGTIRTPATGPGGVAVAGASWMDREWTTSVLGADHIGWDWFSLQLDDGHELMLFRLRRSDGTPDPFLGGTLVAPDGTYRPVDATHFEIEAPGDHWLSPRGARYPTAWRITSPTLDWELAVEAAFDDQEHRLSVAYWEGTVEVSGRVGGRPVRGVGFVEMTGYDER